MKQTVSTIATLTALAACGGTPSARVPIRPGIDVLLRDSIHLVADRRVGLLTNQTGIDAQGVSDLTRLIDAGVQVTAIFSPEHGYRGVLDQEKIADTTESMTGVEIFSLYGETRSPTAEMLALVDVLVMDLQDIGGRPYTYISTVLHAAEAAARYDVPVLVLDRPNPIGGDLRQGPVRDSMWGHDFIGMLQIPQRHGMTLGELALFGNDQLALGADLSVIPATGWTRDLWFDETGLPWVRPSPNMPTLESATHYPGLVLYEATSLSVGRGTDSAFRVIGAPWLDVEAVIADVADLAGGELTAVIISPVDPSDRKFGGVRIPAIEFTVADREVYDPVVAAVHVLAAIHRRHGDALEVNVRRMAQLLGTEAVWSAIVTHSDLTVVVRGWGDDVASFRDRATPYLLYH